MAEALQPPSAAELADAVRSAPHVIAVGAGTKPRLAAVGGEFSRISTAKTASGSFTTKGLSVNGSLQIGDVGDTTFASGSGAVNVFSNAVLAGIGTLNGTDAPSNETASRSSGVCAASAASTSVRAASRA